MKTYSNRYGCKMSFEDGISDEQIQSRLKMFGNNEWFLEDDKSQIKNMKGGNQ